MVFFVFFVCKRRAWANTVATVQKPVEFRSMLLVIDNYRMVTDLISSLLYIVILQGFVCKRRAIAIFSCWGVVVVNY